MKKLVICMILAIILMAVMINVAIGMNDRVEIGRVVRKMEVLSEKTGMKYLGEIELSKYGEKTRNRYGVETYVLDSNVEKTELLKRAELDPESDAFTFLVDIDYSDVATICKLTVYEDGQTDIPFYKRTIKAEYLYSIIY